MENEEAVSGTRAAPKAPLLSVRGLRTEFRTEEFTVRAVDGISYDLHKGRTLAVVGESGSGKSVHALSIMRLLPAPPACRVGGQVLLRGRDLLTLDPESMRRLRGGTLAMVFQEPMTSLNPVMPIGEQIAEAVALHKGASPDAASDAALSLLRRVGIPSAKTRLHDYPHQFSGGMRQRVMIAMALSCGPDILIADEPTTALDVTIQAQILDLMRELQRESETALVLITHNMGVVAETADDVVVMYAGRVVERAPVDALFEIPRHPYTRALLGSVPSLHGRSDRLASISGQPPNLAQRSQGCPFAPRCPEAMAICRAQDPPDFLLSPDHISNCWLCEEEADSSRRRA